MTVSIYALRDPVGNEVRYVGRTTMSLARRLSGHLCAANKGIRRPCSSWVFSLIRQNLEPKIEPIETVSWEQREWAEKKWIAYYRNMGARLLNLTDGGDGTNGFKMPAESVKRSADSHRGKIRTPDHRKKISDALKGRRPSSKCVEALIARSTDKKLSDLTKEKIRVALKARRLTDEHKKKISLSNTGKKRSREAVLVVSAGKRRASINRGSGVCRHREKWRALIFVDGVQKHLGTFHDRESAYKARKEAEARYWC